MPNEFLLPSRQLLGAASAVVSFHLRNSERIARRTCELLIQSTQQSDIETGTRFETVLLTKLIGSWMA